MKGFKWLWIILTAFLVEVAFALYISYLRWYEASTISSILVLAILMAIGAFILLRKVKSNPVKQGAMVGVFGVLIYIIVLIISGKGMTYDLDFYLGNLAKIIGGAIGGFLASRTQKS